MKQLTEGFKWTPLAAAAAGKATAAMPAILSSPRPIYPSASRKRAEEGMVKVQVLIDTEGTPTNLSVSQSSGFPALDHSALEAITMWKFTPAQDGNIPIVKWITIPITFQLTPSAIDQQIAKLSISEDTPVESIRQRLQALEVPTTQRSGDSTDKPSQGKNRYLAMVEETIDRKWIAPSMFLDNNLVVAKFRISRSGEISAIELTNLSGVEEYDEAVTTAIRSAGPFPPFPDSITEDEFNVIYQFIKD
jgi:TonB family protein